MAKVWKVRGSEQRGGPVDDVPWQDCVQLFELDQFSRVEDRPKIGEGQEPSILLTHIAIEVEEAEAKQYSTTAGFYVSPLPVDRALRKLANFRSPKAN